MDNAPDIRLRGLVQRVSMIPVYLAHRLTVDKEGDSAVAGAVAAP